MWQIAANLQVRAPAAPPGCRPPRPAPRSRPRAVRDRGSAPGKGGRNSTEKLLLGAGFLGAPPISLRHQHPTGRERLGGRRRRRGERRRLLGHSERDKWGQHCGRFPKFHRVFVGPRPWHIGIRHRVKKTSTISLFGFETLKLKFRRLKLWKPTVMGSLRILSFWMTERLFGAFF